MVTREEIKSKLEYIGLDIENPSSSLVESKPLGFNVSRLRDDKDLKVYKYINIEDIQILLTPHNNGDELKDKYRDALPLSQYINSNTENPDEYTRYLQFLRMFQFFSEEQLEKIEKEQKEYFNKIPFQIRYPRSHMWSIYYDETTKKYFMLVCTNEADFTEFFYILKKKIELDKKSSNDKDNSNIENNEVDINENLSDYFSDEEKDLDVVKKDESEVVADQYIYAPINYIPLSEVYINSNELLEIENYLWYFTKNWAITYDVYDFKNNHSLVIKGETNIFDRLESDYKFTLTKKEDAVKLYKYIKALFTLESSTDKYFNFRPEIKKNFELALTYNDVEITYEDIPDFIYKQYNKIIKEIEVLNDQNKSKTVKLNMLRDDLAKNEQTYKEKQLEVVQYLDCKKSFSKKVRYFFKRSKRVTRAQLDKSQIKEEVRKKLEEDRKEVEVDYTVIETVRKLEKKELYTIEDFVFIYSLYEKLKRKVSELTLDIRGTKLSLLNINNKLANVEVYLDEIDTHKRSIFEFWRFTNKENKLTLEEAEIDEEDQIDVVEEKQLERVFNFDMDIEAISEKMDEIQRRKLSKEEINAIFLSDKGFLNYINMVKTKDLDEYAIVSFLEDLKKEYKENMKYTGETFDIFGSSEVMAKTRYLKTNEFRENDRNRLAASGFSTSLDKFKFLEKLNEILKYLDEATCKIKTIIGLPVYKILPSIEKIGHNKFETFNIDIQKEIEEFDGVGNNLNLIKINLPKDSPAIFYSNIIYYENQNGTLPLGMDINNKVLLDLEKFELKEIKRDKIVINKYFKNMTGDKTFKNINIIEYDIIEKEV